MGLDMFLEKQTTFFENEVEVKVDGEVADFGHVISLTSAVAHWRDFYPLHSWFVDNVQRGINDHRRYWVLDDDLRELAEHLEVLRFDEPEWMTECNDAISTINKILMDERNKSQFVTFYYQAV